MFVLKSTYQKQLDKNSELIDELDSVRRKAVMAVSNLEGQTRNAKFVIDFDRLRPFSIERNKDDDTPVTIFGYFDKNQDPKEWYIYCSLERHNQFIEEFNGYKAKEKERAERYQ